MQSDSLSLHGRLLIYKWERKDFRGIPTLLYKDENIIPYCGRRSIALMATDPLTYQNRKISNIGLGFHTPLDGVPLDPARQHLISDFPVGPVTVEGVYLPLTGIDVPIFPNSYITYKVDGWTPTGGSYTISEEGLFPVIPWQTGLTVGEENMIIAYKQLSTPIIVTTSMTVDIWHQIRYGSNI